MTGDSFLTNDETAILDRVIVPTEGRLSHQAAESLLGLEFPASDIARMNALAEKNRQGEATADELSELERYSRVGNLISILQSKARRSLSNG
ncbi:MAG: hypothetical protein AAF266_14570 [Planctomycetota bacterium]